MKIIRSAVGLFVLVPLLISCLSDPAPATPTTIPATVIPSPTTTATASPATVIPSPTTTTTAIPATAAPSPTATATAVPTKAPPPNPTAQPAAGAKVETTPSSVLARISAIRGLQAKGGVRLETLSREELRPYLVKMFEKDNGKEELEKAKALWVVLDLIGDVDDLYALWLGLLSEQVVGFYEFESQSMKLIGGGGELSTQDEIILAHEYVHALQDQHFGIGDLVKQVKKDDEKSVALQALLEGDASWAMIDYALKNVSPQALASMQNDMSSFDLQNLRSAPLVLQINLLFPYQYGAAFIASLVRSGGWAAVDKAYANPPTTSEQIMHPEKFLVGEGPQRVELPEIVSVLGSQWSRLDGETIGELGWLVYFAEALGYEEAISAAAGWGGDRYELFRNSSGQGAIAALSSWDTEEDAEEFFDAIYYLQDTYATTRYSLDEDTRVAWTRDSTSGYASIKGKQVLLVISPDEATTEKIVGRFDGF